MRMDAGARVVDAASTDFWWRSEMDGREMA
jgi:hypothetical protein